MNAVILIECVFVPLMNVKLKEHPERGVYVRELSMHTVHSVGECERIIEQGWRNRAVGYTLMNKDSSRSHSIFTIHLEICNTGTHSYIFVLILFHTLYSVFNTWKHLFNVR